MGHNQHFWNKEDVKIFIRILEMLSRVFFPVTHLAFSHTFAQLQRSPQQKGTRRISLVCVYSKLVPYHQCFHLSSPHFQNTNYCYISAPCDDVLFPLSNLFRLISPGGLSTVVVHQPPPPATGSPLLQSYGVWQWCLCPFFQTPLSH